MDESLKRIKKVYFQFLIKSKGIVLFFLLSLLSLMMYFIFKNIFTETILTINIFGLIFSSLYNNGLF